MRIRRGNQAHPKRMEMFQFVESNPHEEVWANNVMGGDIKMKLTLILQLFYFHTHKKWCITIVSSSFLNDNESNEKLRREFVLKNSFVFRSLFKTLNTIFVHIHKSINNISCASCTMNGNENWMRSGQWNEGTPSKWVNSERNKIFFEAIEMSFFIHTHLLNI